MSKSGAVDPSVRSFRSFGDGLKWFLMVEGALFVTLFPTLVAFVFMPRSPGFIFLFALAAAPVGPAVQAGMYALRRGDNVGNESPWGRYWEGWRSGWRQALSVWLPAVLLAGIALVVVALGSSRDGMFGLVVAVLMLTGVVITWSVAALTVVSAFSFRTRDLLKVSLYGMGARPLKTIGMLVLVFAAVGLLFVALEPVLVIFAVLFCYALLALARPMHAVIRELLTKSEAGSQDDSDAVNGDVNEADNEDVNQDK